MRRLALLSAVLALGAGCAVPTDPVKQAEDIGSVAAEGSLLAHDAAEGRTTTAFTRVHADALRGLLGQLESKLADDRLARLLHDVDAALAGLEEHPSDEAAAARAERRLERAARQARELSR